MKSETMGFIAPINKQDMKELLNETKETIATGLLSKEKNICRSRYVEDKKKSKDYRSLRRLI
jgi:hypothetical protein